MTTTIDTRSTTTTTTLYRAAGWTGLLAGTLLLVAAARRGGLIPENTLTHAIAPPASALALFTLTAVYLLQSNRIGRIGLVGYALNLLGLAGLFAIEFTTHAVFPYLAQPTRDELLDGPTRIWFTVVAVTFLAGVLAFGVASLRARVLPAPAVVLYLAGFVPASLRGIVPEAVYLGGLCLGVIGVVWFSVVLTRLTSEGRP